MCCVAYLVFDPEDGVNGVLQNWGFLQYGKDILKYGSSRMAGVGGIIWCHVSSWRGEPIEPAVSVSCYEVVNMALKLGVCQRGPKPAIHFESWRRPSEGALLLHDSPHIAARI
jgi:hypothetical protein